MSTVTYEEAVSILQSMFQTVDNEIICSVLQANKGHLESTIDFLLSMTGETNNDTVKESSTTQQSEQPREIPPEQVAQTISQVEQDELLARVIQNELFVQDMKEPRREREEGLSPSLDEDLSLKEIKEKIGHFSEAAKLKYRELMTRFVKKDPSAKYSTVSVDETTDSTLTDSTLSRRPKHNEDEITNGEFEKKDEKKDEHKTNNNTTANDVDEEPQSPQLVDKRRLQRAENKKDN